LFTDTERRKLGALAKEIGIKALQELTPVVSPATLLRWHRQLVAQKWTFLERRRPGRPRTPIDIEQLVVRMAHENPSWGYTRIHGALLNLDIKVGRGTIRRILKDHLIEPAPRRARRIPWSVFLKSHWRAIAASDFFAVEGAPSVRRSASVNKMRRRPSLDRSALFSAFKYSICAMELRSSQLAMFAMSNANKCGGRHDMA
jgi:hypothetical protein